MIPCQSGAATSPFSQPFPSYTRQVIPLLVSPTSSGSICTKVLVAPRARPRSIGKVTYPNRAFLIALCIGVRDERALAEPDLFFDAVPCSVCWMRSLRCRSGSWSRRGWWWGWMLGGGIWGASWVWCECSWVCDRVTGSCICQIWCFEWVPVCSVGLTLDFWIVPNRWRRMFWVFILIRVGREHLEQRRVY